MAPFTALSFGVFAVVPAILHAITPNEMRGQTGAIYSLFDNALGIALGSTVVAVLTDFVFRDPMALGRSMTLVSLVLLPCCAFLLATTLKHFRGSVDAASAWSTPSL